MLNLNLNYETWQQFLINIISPANNAPIIGIFQDSMLGCYRFTRENVKFTPREAMNLLMMHQRVDDKTLLLIRWNSI